MDLQQHVSSGLLPATRLTGEENRDEFVRELASPTTPAGPVPRAEYGGGARRRPRLRGSGAGRRGSECATGATGAVGTGQCHPPAGPGGVEPAARTLGPA